jgi:hypothetical protein
MADHGSAERLRFFFYKRKALQPRKRDFRLFFRTRWAAARNTILRLFKTIHEEVSVKEEKLPPAPNLPSPEAVDGQS